MVRFRSVPRRECRQLGAVCLKGEDETGICIVIGVAIDEVCVRSIPSHFLCMAPPVRASCDVVTPKRSHAPGLVYRLAISVHPVKHHPPHTDDLPAYFSLQESRFCHRRSCTTGHAKVPGFGIDAPTNTQTRESLYHKNFHDAVPRAIDKRA